MKGKKIEINAENPYVLLCVYGTLRLDQGNYHYYLEGRSEYLGTFQTEPKYTMFGFNAGFPIVAPNGNTAITCDVFKVIQQRVLERIHGLEGFKGTIGDAANWYDCKEIETPYGKGYMYIQPNHHGLANQIISSGDWLHHKLIRK